MTPHLDQLWVYMQANPLGWLTATLIAYWVGVKAQRAAGGRPYVNPVAIAVIMLVALLAATGTPYQTYSQRAQFVHFLLGPATVALAIPLYENWPAVRSEEHTSELQSLRHLVCRLLLEKKNITQTR